MGLGPSNERGPREEGVCEGVMITAELGEQGGEQDRREEAGNRLETVDCGSAHRVLRSRS